MKAFKFIQLSVAALVLTLSASGCKHKTPMTTHFDKSGQTGTMQGLGPGEKIGDTSGGGTPLSGIPANSPEAHAGWPEDATTLAGDTVHFAFDSSVVQPDEKSKVAAVADYLKSNGGNAVKIAGHCDERGTEEYNRSLGERRALALREELVGLGIEASRVDTISFGKDRPVAQGHDESAWRQNRRGEFIVLTPPK